MRDIPRFDFDMVKCLTANELATAACPLPRSRLLAPVSPLNELTGLAPDREGTAVTDTTRELLE